MQYILGQTAEFEVIKDFGDQEDFFRLRLPSGREVRLNKLKFQKAEQLPDRLKCRVKFADKSGTPILGHYMPQYVSRFYKVSIGEHLHDYEFKVKSLPSHPGGHFILEDQYGIRYNLVDDGAMLAEGQKVLCRFTKLTSSFFNLELANGEMRIPFYSPADFLARIGAPRHFAAYICRNIGQVLPEVQAEIESGSPLWVVSALKEAVANIADWSVNSDIKRHLLFFTTLLHTLRNGGLYLIENSRFLRNISGVRRRNLQAIITEALETLDPYRSTICLVRDGQQTDFVESLLEKLRESGYLYHPARQLSMLMMIFRTQPKLVHQYLGQLFETLMAWKLDTWTTEPFRSAIVDQLEIYIRRTSREIDLLPQADTEEESDCIEKIVTAIALQMMISGDTTNDRYRRNRSLFYRYISLMRPVKSDDLLDKAFLTLMGVKLPLDFTYDTIKEPLMLMTRATIKAPEDTTEIQSLHTFSEGSATLTISSEGLILSRSDEQNAGRVLPNGMMAWLSPQIYLEGVQSLNGNQLNNFDAHRRLWSSIENALFEQRLHSGPTPRHKRKAEIGDRVFIAIAPDETSRGDNPRWVALIDDEEFHSDAGFIFRDDIVSFALRSTDLDRNRALIHDAFVDETGRPRKFSATVKDITDSGAYHFSLLEDVAEQVDNIMNFNDDYLAVIAQPHEHEYSAISDAGYGVYLRKDPELPEYKAGDVVVFRVIERNSANHILGTIVDEAEQGQAIDKVRAFRNLLAGICIGDDSDENDNQNALLDVDEALSREDVLEIIELIRFKCISTTTLIVAYDYLRLARLLALLINDEQLAQRLSVHAELLRMHQFYATNKRIDRDELEQYRDEISGYPLLQLVFHRLELVSWLGDTDRNADLWNTVNLQRNLLEANLARLVLAYNMLPDSPGDTQVAEGLKTRIAKMLGVNFEARQLKSYGRENQFIEFKSSLVYPARRHKEKVKADPEAQQHVILRVIASFLNSSGGTLYIGVNDATRCEAGLFEDYEYYRYRKAAIGTFIYDMRNADNICVFLTNLVRSTWNNNVGESVQIERDEEASHDVIIVKVQPRVQPVELDGKIYVRRSNNTMTLTDEERAEFIEERRLLEIRSREELHIADSKNIDEPTSSAPQTQPEPIATKVEPAVSVQTDIPTETSPSVEHQKAYTSRWRPNVLHNWEEGYVNPAGYIYFKEGATITVTRKDRNSDYEPDCLLALSFTPEEARQGFLIMIFEGQKLLKVPMSEVLEKGYDLPVGHYKDSALLFATVAMPTMSLLVHITDSKDTIYRRVIPVSAIVSSHLTTNAPNITEISTCSRVVGAELVAPGSEAVFSGSMLRDLSSRQIGYTLRTQANTDKAAEIFDADCINCLPR